MRRCTFPLLFVFFLAIGCGRGAQDAVAKQESRTLVELWLTAKVRYYATYIYFWPDAHASGVGEFRKPKIDFDWTRFQEIKSFRINSVGMTTSPECYEVDADVEMASAQGIVTVSLGVVTEERVQHGKRLRRIGRVYFAGMTGPKGSRLSELDLTIFEGHEHWRR